MLIVVASSFFRSLWSKLVLDFNFCINFFYKNSETVLLKKEQQAKNKLSME